MKRPSDILIPAMERPGWVISGWRTDRVKMCSLSGTRLYFYEALDHAPKEAGWILIQIGHLYGIERRLRHQEAGPALREAHRTSQSTPLYQQSIESCNVGSSPGA